MAAISAVGPPTGLLEQGVALAQDALEVAAQGVVAGMKGDEQVVEVLPAALRTALDQRQVVGREHGDLERTEQVAGCGAAAGG